MDEIGLRESPGMLEGGVSRFPTLTMAGVDCVAGTFPSCRNFCAIFDGGGSSKLGRFEAADLRAMRL